MPPYDIQCNEPNRGIRCVPYIIFKAHLNTLFNYWCDNKPKTWACMSQHNLGSLSCYVGPTYHYLRLGQQRARMPKFATNQTEHGSRCNELLKNRKRTKKSMWIMLSSQSCFIAFFKQLSSNCIFYHYGNFSNDTFLWIHFQLQYYHPNSLLIHLNVYYWNKVWCIFQPNIYVVECCHGWLHLGWTKTTS